MKEEILQQEGQILLVGEVHGHPKEKRECSLSETSLPDGLWNSNIVNINLIAWWPVRRNKIVNINLIAWWNQQ